MDDPTLDRGLHKQALRGLSRVHGWTGTVACLWPDLVAAYESKRRRAPGADPEPTLRILDVACGGGDVALGLRGRAAREDWDVVIDGADVSERAGRPSGKAGRRAREAGGAIDDVKRLDAVTDPLPGGYDVMMSTLFLHHLSDDDAVTVLRKMADAAPRVWVSDLRRGKLAYGFTVAGTRLVSRSPVVHKDGPQSVRAGWERDELEALALRAGMTPDRGRLQVKSRLPFRLELRWVRTGDA